MQNVYIEIKWTLLLPPPPPSSLSHSHTPMHTNLNNWIRWDGLKRGEKERERIRRGKTDGAGSFILLNIIERLP